MSSFQRVPSLIWTDSKAWYVVRHSNTTHHFIDGANLDCAELSSVYCQLFQNGPARNFGIWRWLSRSVSIRSSGTSCTACRCCLISRRKAKEGALSPLKHSSLEHLYRVHMANRSHRSRSACSRRRRRSTRSLASPASCL